MDDANIIQRTRGAARLMLGASRTAGAAAMPTDFTTAGRDHRETSMHRAVWATIVATLTVAGTRAGAAESPPALPPEIPFDSVPDPLQLPTGMYLGEDYHRAGGVPAVIGELMRGRLLPNPDALTVNGKPIGANCEPAEIINDDVIRRLSKPLKAKAGFVNLKGSLFDSAIMKTSVISEEFRQRYLSNPKDPEAFEGKVVVFDGPEDYHARIEDPKTGIDEHTILVIRGVGPIGYPGAAEVVNMQPPASLMARGIHSLPCIGDGRQSGTSGSPSILNASPEAAAGGGLALLQTGDRVRIDLKRGEANILIPEKELASRRKDLEARGGYPYPAHQTPWQEIQRGMVDQLAKGMVLKPAVAYQRIAQTKGLPRDNH